MIPRGTYFFGQHYCLSRHASHTADGGLISEGPIQEYARVRARESKVSRGMVANCSRPIRLIQSMLMPVQIATRANALTPSPNLTMQMGRTAALA
jgi:hypothetical protein